VSPIITPGALGYRKLGDLPNSVGVNPAKRLAETLAAHFGYEALYDSTCVRLSARRHGRPVPETLILERLVTADALLTDEDVARIAADVEALHADLEVPRPVATDQDFLGGLVDGAVAQPGRWLGLAQIGRAVMGCRPDRLPRLFTRHVLPALFRMYPAGKLTIWRCNADSPGAFGPLRFLYGAALLPLAEVRDQGFRGFQSQQHALQQDVYSKAPVLFDFLSYLFFPFVGGFHFSLGPFFFVFLFDTAEQIEPPPLPSDWLSAPRVHAGYGRERFELLQVVNEPPSPARTRAAMQKAVHLTGFGVEERLTFLMWLVARFNRLVLELNDVCNFLSDPADVDSEVDPIGAFEHLLTVDRVSRSTMLAMSHTEPTAARSFAFEVADLLGELAARHQGVKPASFTKRLLNPAEGPGLLRPCLARLPTPFADYFSSHAGELYARVENAAIDSVWVRSRVSADGVRVKAKDLRTDETLSRGEFVAELLRATRNAHHGYLSADWPNQNVPARFLAISDGNLPVELASLPAVWWLAFLADPALVGWRHLPMSHFPE
jgi:hypothetical protein